MADASVGTPQTNFAPDAARQQQVAQDFFYTLGDIFGGTDVSARVSSTNGNAVDVAVDATGTPYVRGSTQTLFGGPTYVPLTSTPAATQAGFTITPGMLLAGVLAIFLITRNKGK